MELPRNDFLPEMTLAAAAALSAGEQVARIYSGHFLHTLKNGREPLTEADTLSDKIIRNTLSAAGYAMLSEESPDTAERLGREKVWIIDPLDGTKDFINRTGEFSVMIALVEAGIPILGVVFCPVDDVLYIAEAGKGAYVRRAGVWQAIQASTVAELAKARAVVSRNHLTSQEELLIKKLNLFSFIQKGSSGLKIAEVASGQADLYFTFSDKIKQWDTAAAYCIIKETGGEMTDMRGQRLEYNTPDVYHKDGILVTNGRLHASVVQLSNA